MSSSKPPGSSEQMTPRRTRRVAPCWQKIRHVCGYDHRPQDKSSRYPGIEARIAEARRHVSDDAEAGRLHPPRTSQTMPTPMAIAASPAIRNAFVGHRQHFGGETSWQGRESRHRPDLRSRGRGPWRRQNRCTGRYWRGAGLCRRRGRVPSAAKPASPDRCLAVGRSRKKRKNSEFGDSTIVVPVLSSAVPIGTASTGRSRRTPGRAVSVGEDGAALGIALAAQDFASLLRFGNDLDRLAVGDGAGCAAPLRCRVPAAARPRPGVRPSCGRRSAARPRPSGRCGGCAHRSISMPSAVGVRPDQVADFAHHRGALFARARPRSRAGRRRGASAASRRVREPLLGQCRGCPETAARKLRGSEMR